MRLLAVLQTDCPTCRLIAPYLNRLVAGGASLSGLSQDPAAATNEFARQMEIAFPLELDVDCKRSVELGVATVPTLFLLEDNGRVVRQEPGFDKTVLNQLAAVFGVAPVASEHDGAPAMKPGCSSRHLEPQNADANAPALDLHGLRGIAASRFSVADSDDPYEFCSRAFGDGLPVVPPTEDRVRRMLEAVAMDPREVVARVPPWIGAVGLGISPP